MSNVSNILWTSNSSMAVDQVISSSPSLPLDHSLFFLILSLSLSPTLSVLLSFFLILILHLSLSLSHTHSLSLSLFFSLSGSVSSSILSCDDVTIGSGLFLPGLFDDYRTLNTLRPSCGYAHIQYSPSPPPPSPSPPPSPISFYSFSQALSLFLRFSSPLFRYVLHITRHPLPNVYVATGGGYIGMGQSAENSFFRRKKGKEREKIN